LLFTSNILEDSEGLINHYFVIVINIIGIQRILPVHLVIVLVDPHEQMIIFGDLDGLTGDVEEPKFVN
jgi:hypothetical protein